jgi:hypothetical protein
MYSARTASFKRMLASPNKSGGPLDNEECVEGELKVKGRLEESALPRANAVPPSALEFRKEYSAAAPAIHVPGAPALARSRT